MYPTALLIDRQKWRRMRCRVPKGSTQIRDLFGRAAVLFEENKTAKSVLFKNQFLIASQRLALAADDKRLTERLPQPLHVGNIPQTGQSLGQRVDSRADG